jgi:hypothetical protein
MSIRRGGTQPQRKLVRLLTRLSGAAAVIALLTVGLGSASAASSSSSNLFAIVAQDGTLVHGGGVSSVTHVSTGQYEVTFTQDVSGCAYAASTQNAYSQALLISTDGGHSSADGVFVETKNQGGGLTDGPFNLIVNCGSTGMQYAVVGYSEDLVRSTPGTTLTNLGTGRYDVNFPASVSSCAFLSTIGDPGNGVVVNPALVATSSGTSSNTVYVETKNLGGGLTSGIPFHLSVICPSAPSTKELVVAASGYAQRGSPLTTSFNTGTGTYTVATNRTIANTCAAVATRGQTNTSVPYAPATVETAPGPAPNTFDVQTRLPLDLSGGGQGTFKNEAFHTAIVC